MFWPGSIFVFVVEENEGFAYSLNSRFFIFVYTSITDPLVLNFRSFASKYLVKTSFSLSDLYWIFNSILPYSSSLESSSLPLDFFFPFAGFFLGFTSFTSSSSSSLEVSSFFFFLTTFFYLTSSLDEESFYGFFFYYFTSIELSDDDSFFFIYLVLEFLGFSSLSESEFEYFFFFESFIDYCFDFLCFGASSLESELSSIFYGGFLGRGFTSSEELSLT